MDACAVTQRALGQDSPSNKVLFAKDVFKYKKMVNQFFTDVASTDRIKADEINEILNQCSQNHGEIFNEMKAVEMLFEYVDKYEEKISEAIRTKGSQELSNNAIIHGYFLSENANESNGLIV